ITWCVHAANAPTLSQGQGQACRDLSSASELGPSSGAVRQGRTAVPPGKVRMLRVTHDYDRGGALAYLAAWDVGPAQVHVRCADQPPAVHCPGHLLAKRFPTRS